MEDSYPETGREKSAEAAPTKQLQRRLTCYDVVWLVIRHVAAATGHLLGSIDLAANQSGLFLVPTGVDATAITTSGVLGDAPTLIESQLSLANPVVTVVDAATKALDRVTTSGVLGDAPALIESH